MSNQITQVKYDELQAIAKTLGNESEAFEQLHASTRNKIEALQNEWHGDAAKAFFAEANTLLPAVQRVSTSLVEAQSVLKQIMKIIHDADVETASYFKGLGAEGTAAKSSRNLFAPKWGDAITLFKAGIAGYVISRLGASIARPNSVILKVPPWIRKYVLGLKSMTTVIKPTTLLKKLTLKVSPVAGLITAVGTFFTDPKYAGTKGALPAAVIDGLVKTAINTAGGVALYGAGVVVTAGLAAVGAGPVLVGGAVIGTWVAGGYIVDKVFQAPVMDTWKNSDMRDQLVNTGTRLLDNAGDFNQKLTDGVQNTKKAFDGFIKNLMPSPT